MAKLVASRSTQTLVDLAVKKKTAREKFESEVNNLVAVLSRIEEMLNDGHKINVLKNVEGIMRFTYMIENFLEIWAVNVEGATLGKRGFIRILGRFFGRHDDGTAFVGLGISIMKHVFGWHDNTSPDDFPQLWSLEDERWSEPYGIMFFMYKIECFLEDWAVNVESAYTRKVGIKRILQRINFVKDRVCWRDNISSEDSPDLGSPAAEESRQTKDLKILTDLVKSKRVVWICGVEGIGKTSLAKKVYYHPKVRTHFDAFAWVSFTEHRDITSLLRNIQNQLVAEEKKKDSGDSQGVNITKPGGTENKAEQEKGAGGEERDADQVGKKGKSEKKKDEKAMKKSVHRAKEIEEKDAVSKSVDQGNTKEEEKEKKSAYVEKRKGMLSWWRRVPQKEKGAEAVKERADSKEEGEEEEKEKDAGAEQKNVDQEKKKRLDEKDKGAEAVKKSDVDQENLREEEEEKVAKAVEKRADSKEEEEAEEKEKRLDEKDKGAEAVKKSDVDQENLRGEEEEEKVAKTVEKRADSKEKEEEEEVEENEKRLDEKDKGAEAVKKSDVDQENLREEDEEEKVAKAVKKRADSKEEEEAEENEKQLDEKDKGAEEVNKSVVDQENKKEEEEKEKGAEPVRKSAYIEKRKGMPMGRRKKPDKGKGAGAVKKRENIKEEKEGEIGVEGVQKNAHDEKEKSGGAVRNEIEEEEKEQTEDAVKKIVVDQDNKEEAPKSDDQKQLIKELKEIQGNKNCFIVIDDMWKTSQWKEISSAFDCKETRILLTTPHTVSKSVDQGNAKEEEEMEKGGEAVKKSAYVEKRKGMLSWWRRVSQKEKGAEAVKERADSKEEEEEEEKEKDAGAEQKNVGQEKKKRLDEKDNGADAVKKSDVDQENLREEEEKENDAGAEQKNVDQEKKKRLDEKDKGVEAVKKSDVDQENLREEEEKEKVAKAVKKRTDSKEEEEAKDKEKQLDEKDKGAEAVNKSVVEQENLREKEEKEKGAERVKKSAYIEKRKGMRMGRRKKPEKGKGAGVVKKRENTEEEEEEGEIGVEALQKNAHQEKKKSTEAVRNEIEEEEKEQRAEAVKKIIVMDDISEEISPALDCKETRILLTTPHTTTIPDAVSHEEEKADKVFYELKPLDEKEGWKLLKKLVFYGKRAPEKGIVSTLAKEMLVKCNGLPLTISTLGRILSAKSPSEWHKVHNDVVNYLEKDEYKIQSKEKSDDLPTGLKKIKIYDHLTYYKKQCFLFLAVFKGNEDVDSEDLRLLWMAEGMVPSHRQPPMDEAKHQQSTMNDAKHAQETIDIAEEYVEELADKLTANGKFKPLHLHNEARELSLQYGVREDFRLKVLDFSGGKQPTILPCFSVRRLAIHFNKLSSSLEEDALCGTPLLRSLFFLNSDREYTVLPVKISDFKKFILLRVLHFVRCKFVGRKLPQGIDELFNLRYLGVIYCDLDELPASIRNVKNLHILNVRAYDDAKITIPNDVYKMARLKHLRLPDNLGGEQSTIPRGNSVDEQSNKLKLDGLHDLESLDGFNADIHDVDSLSNLENLRHLVAHASSNDSLESIIKFVRVQGDPDHHRVSVRTNLYVESKCNFNSEEGLEILEEVLMCPHIHALTLSMVRVDQFPNCGIYASEDLTEIRLIGCRLSKDPMGALGKFPNLRKLCFGYGAFIGREMTILNDESFPTLEYLELSRLSNLEKWTAGKGAMKSLQALTVNWCPNLNESTFGTSLKNLQMELEQRNNDEDETRFFKKSERRSNDDDKFNPSTFDSSLKKSHIRKFDPSSSGTSAVH